MKNNEIEIKKIANYLQQGENIEELPHDSIELIIEVLEKEVAIKPKIVTINEPHTPIMRKVYCPICSSQIYQLKEIDAMRSYCPKCGQKINWWSIISGTDPAFKDRGGII